MKNFYRRFTVVSIFLVSLLVAVSVAVAVRPVVGLFAGVVAAVIMAIPLLPFIASFNFALLPPDLERLIKSDAEISGEDLARIYTDLRAQVNAIISGLPAVEQFEAAPELVWALKTFRTAAAQLLEIQEAMSTAMRKFTTQAQAKAEASAAQKLIDKGDFVKKTDAEAARDTAVNDAKEEVRNEVKTDAENKNKIVAARAKLVTDKVLLQAGADALPDDFFKADGYDARVTALQARLTKLRDEKLDHSETFVAEVIALPYDDAGNKNFDNRLATVKSLVGSKASRQSGGGAAAGAVGAGASETKKPRVTF